MAEIETLNGGATTVVTPSPEDKPAESTPEVAPDTETPETAQGPQATTETAETTSDTPSLTIESAAEESPLPGVSQDDLTQFSEEFTSEGKLTDESYEKLSQAGYGREMVDAYIRGVQATQEDATKPLLESVGGQGEFNKMAKWASRALSGDELDAYNEAVNSTDVTKASLAVQNLHLRYQTANPSLVQGGHTSPAGDVFEDAKQMTTAIQDPRYSTSEAYRKAVQDKIARSPNI